MVDVLRMWRGWIRTVDREEYATYLQETGVGEYRETPGNIDATALFRDRDDGTTEVVTISRWESMDAVRAFAGDEPSVARFYSEDDRFLIGREPFATHFDVVG